MANIFKGKENPLSDWPVFAEHEEELSKGLVHRLRLQQPSSLLSQRFKLITILERHR
jgi:hypothetical protein